MNTITQTLCAHAQTPALAGVYISSVRIAYLRTPMQYAWLTIIWSMPDTTITAPVELGLHKPTATAQIASRPSDTVLAVPVDLASPAELEEQVLQAAWELGAWDMVRLERPPLPPCTDWREARYGLAGDFGQSGLSIMGQPIQAGEQAAEHICERAASEGYSVWRFIPLSLAAPWRRKRWGGEHDATLLPDCTRDGSPSLRTQAFRHPSVPGYGHEQIYQFGRKARPSKKA